MRIPALRYETARLLREARWADLRSPAEHARDAIPGAVSAPLFDDEERALVGTLYQQVSPDAAYERGLGLAAARMPELLGALCGRAVAAEEWRAAFASLSERLRGGAAAVATEAVATLPDRGRGWIVLYCWRGGMRSRSVAALLHELGMRVALLEGGYKAYRSWILARLAAWPPAVPSPFVLISGATGTGKTLLLAELEAAAPGSTLDLEACAGHRSSILGAVGREPVSQAAFETRIAARAEELGPPPWFVEAESRKVGDVIVPETLWRAMRGGFVVELRAEPSTRIQVLVDDYLATPGAAARIAERLPFLEARLGPGWDGRLTALNAAGRHAEVAALLLEHYYDPLYAHSGRELVPRVSVAREDPSRVQRLLALREGRVELASRPCADSSGSPDFPAATPLPSSTRD